MSSVTQPAAAPDVPRASTIGRWVSLAGAMVGLGLVAVLLAHIGLGRILDLVARAGWWLPLVVVLHLPQTALSAAGWRALFRRGEGPSLPRLYLYRWIREAVNSLLPVAQVGGEVVRTRLAARGELGLARAGASCALDITVELFAQVVFTLMGLALLVRVRPHAGLVRPALAGAGVILAIAFFLAFGQRFMARPALAGLKGRLAARWPGGAFRADAQQKLASGGWHLLSWLAGAFETWAAMRAVGLPASGAEAMIVESLTQVVRVAAFAVPGAVGVQEGGLILICGLFGASPAAAVGVSLVRRLREVALGAPGLLAWRMVEGRA